MELLRLTIQGAVQWYRVDAWVATYVKKMNVHEIVGPAGLVLAALRNEANSGVVDMFTVSEMGKRDHTSDVILWYRGWDFASTKKEGSPVQLRGEDRPH